MLLAGVLLWVTPSRQTSSAQDNKPMGPLIARGFTDAPTGSVTVGGDLTNGGGVLIELRVIDGQRVKKGEVIGVLSNFALSAACVAIDEAELAKAETQREAMMTGFRVTEIAAQEAVVRSSEASARLKALEVARSGKTPDMRQLELDISQHDIERDQAKLRQLIDTLDADRRVMNFDIAVLKSRLENSRAKRDAALIRSPVDGVVVQVLVLAGERIVQLGIVKIVDFSQVRVFADVDEVHLGRIAAGGKVEVVFRGNPTSHKGKIARIAPTVKRMQRIEPDGASSTDARVVQVDIELDDPSGMPQVLGRETRVTFF